MGKVPPYLADREAQLGRFKRYLADFPENQRNVRITGLRGVGKTVLLKECRKLALADDWVVVKRDLTPRFQDENDFALALGEDMQQAVEQLSTGEKLKRVAGDALQSIGGLGVNVGAVGVTLPSGTTSPRERILEDRLRDALVKLGRLAAEAGRGVAFFFDEAHVVSDRKRDGQFPLSALLAAFVEAQDYEDADLPVMLVMCGLQSLVTNLQAARSHSERLFKAELIEYLSLTADAAGLSPAVVALTKPAEDTVISFDPRTAQRIAEDVSGYPYFIQWYGEALWDAADDSNIAVIDDELYAANATAIQDGLDAEFFDGRYDETRRNEQATLRVTSSLGGETFRTADLIAEFETKKQPAIQMSLNRLIGDNLIYRIRQGEYGYTAPLFGEYLRRKHPRTDDDR